MIAGAPPHIFVLIYLYNHLLLGPTSAEKKLVFFQK